MQCRSGEGERIRDANAAFPARVGSPRGTTSRDRRALSESRREDETPPRKFLAADDDAKPAGAPNELELKDFLEEYFTHGDACPCYESMDADAARGVRERGRKDGTRGSRYDDTFTSHGETFYASNIIL